MKTVPTLLLIACCLVPLAFAQKAEDMDLLRLTTGQIIEGCITQKNQKETTIETVGGVFIVPGEKIKNFAKAQPGESALVLGRTLLKQNDFSRAEQFLLYARDYEKWRPAAMLALDRLQKLRKEREEKNKQKEQQRIESIIRHQGLQAGIDELKKQNQTSYWGSYRGKLHLLMARDRLDHLDIQQAERHLALAEQYGVNPGEWDTVRDELMEYKKKSILFGKEKLAKLYKKNPTPVPQSTHFLARVKTARQNGTKIPPREWLEHVDRNAKLNRLDPLLVWAMIDVESSWRPKVVSRVGAQGLMQLMPQTAAELEVADPFNPGENIRGGTKYMRFLLTMFNDLDTALAAYNVGPGRVERYNGIPPAGKRYIKKVQTRFAALKKQFGV